MNALTSALTLIIQVIFDAYIILLLLRLLLQKLRASWHNPISQFLVTLTEKPLKSLRKIAPGYKGFDLSILLFAAILQYIEVTLLFLLQMHSMPHILGTLLITIGEMASKLVYIYIYAIIINAIMSWAPSLQQHPASNIVTLIISPLLSRARQIIPVISGIDLSPLPVLLGLMLINILLIGPLLAAGSQLAVS